MTVALETTTKNESFVSKGKTLLVLSYPKVCLSFPDQSGTQRFAVKCSWLLILPSYSKMISCCKFF